MLRPKHHLYLHIISAQKSRGLFSNRQCLPSLDFTDFMKKLSKSAVENKKHFLHSQDSLLYNLSHPKENNNS